MKKLDLARFQKSRESDVKAGGYTFVIRRPSQLDVARVGAEGGNVGLDFACRYVVGWPGLLESDLLPGGDPEPVEFDSDLFVAWIADKPDLWQPIIAGVIESFRRHEEASEDRGNV